MLSDNYFFRNIIIKFLLLLGNEHHIFRDIARTICGDGCFIGGKSYKEMKGFRTPTELVHSVSENRIGINLNKRNLNAAFCLMIMSKYVDEKEWGVLGAVEDEKIHKWITSKKGPFWSEEDIVRKFVYEYYIDKLYPDRFIDYRLTNEYVDKCLDANEKISLRFNSPNRLSKVVEELGLRDLTPAKELDFQIPLIPIDTDFALLREWLPTEFTWIDTAEKLYEEGVKQHSCVYDYRTAIRQDQSTIYHWDNGFRNYTIEFGIDNGSYYIKQMQSRFNGPCEADDRRKVESYIS